MYVILLSCVILLYSLHVLEALRPGRQPKQPVVKKLNSYIHQLRATRQPRVASRAQYIHRLTDEYMCHLSVPWPPSQYTNAIGYIHRFHVTDEYIVTFIGNDEQVDLNSSELRSSVDSSVNQQIYTMFVGLEGIFIGLEGIFVGSNRRLNLCFL
jgi:hypothetical protein